MKRSVKPRRAHNPGIRAPLSNLGHAGFRPMRISESAIGAPAPTKKRARSNNATAATDSRQGGPNGPPFSVFFTQRRASLDLQIELAHQGPPFPLLVVDILGVLLGGRRQRVASLAADQRTQR